MSHQAATNIIIERDCAAAMKNTAVVEITAEGVKCREKTTGEESFVEADTIIIATGSKAKTMEAYSFQGDIPEFSVIGDCKTVGNIYGSTMTGYYAAMDL